MLDEAYGTEGLDLSEEFGAQVIGDAIKVEDVLRKLATVMPLPLADVLDVGAIGVLGAVVGALSGCRLLFADGGELPLEDGGLTSGRASGEGLVWDGDGGPPPRIDVLVVLGLLHDLLLGRRLAVGGIAQVAGLGARALPGGGGSEGRVDGIGHVCEREATGRHGGGVDGCRGGDGRRCHEWAAPGGQVGDDSEAVEGVCLGAGRQSVGGAVARSSATRSTFSSDGDSDSPSGSADGETKQRKRRRARRQMHEQEQQQRQQQQATATRVRTGGYLHGMDSREVGDVGGWRVVVLELGGPCPTCCVYLMGIGQDAPAAIGPAVASTRHASGCIRPDSCPILFSLHRSISSSPLAYRPDDGACLSSPPTAGPDARWQVGATRRRHGDG